MTTLTPLGFEMLARAEKARSLAAAFRASGITAADVLTIQPDQWRDLTAKLKDAGVLKPNASVPSAATISMIVAELARVERRRPMPCSHPRTRKVA